MKTYITENNNIFFAGDLHGNFDIINVTINRYNLSDCSIIICGDIGIGFEKEEYYKQTFNHITKTLKKHNIHLYMFRGNHDNPNYFDGKHFIEFEYIHVIPDYSVIQTPLRNILCIGGAISIDRELRIVQMNMLAKDYAKYHNCSIEVGKKNAQQLYWENEKIIYDEKELSKLEELNIKIDTICSHTSPSFCKPLTKEGIKTWLTVDKNLENDLNDERKVCDLILEYLKLHNHPISNWYYGHYHFHNTEIINEIKYVALDMSRNYLDLYGI